MSDAAAANLPDAAKTERGPQCSAQSSRTRLLIVPREHGAWGILLIPLITGAAVGLGRGSNIGALLLFTVIALALFWVRTPIESLLGTTPMRAQTEAERHWVIKFIVGLAAVSVISIGMLLWHGRHMGLIALGAVAGLLFAMQSAARRFGRGARMATQMIGALGLTCTAAGAYYVVTGGFDVRALALWLANWLFAGNQIHYVQLRIRGSKVQSWTEKFAAGRSFFIGQIIMLLLVTLGWCAGYLPAAVILAFVPIFVRGLMWFFSGPGPLRVHHLGKTELAHAIVFGVLLVAAFHF